jgi:hypothetical protein
VFAGRWPGHLADGEVVPPSTALQRLGWMITSMGYGLVLALPLLAVFGWRVARSDAPRDRRLLVAFLLFNLAWVTASSNFVEVGDNNRYRYDIDGFYLALLGLALQAAWVRWRARG